jgi:hypothetical protein
MLWQYCRGQGHDETVPCILCSLDPDPYAYPPPPSQVEKGVNMLAGTLSCISAR